MSTTQNARLGVEGSFLGETKGSATRRLIAGLVELAIARMRWEGRASPVVIKVAGPANEPEVEIPLRYAGDKA